MTTKQGRQRRVRKTRKDAVSLSLSPEMTAWLRHAAARKMTSISQVVREYLIPHYEARSTK